VNFWSAARIAASNFFPGIVEFMELLENFPGGCSTDQKSK
jgi:hypothetical protein